MADTKPCPWHRIGLDVIVIERRHHGPGCGGWRCTLQAGHDGDCEPGEESEVW